MKQKTLLLLLVLPALVWAGGLSSLPVGARTVSLGGSIASLSDDPALVFYNPAGLAGFTRLSVAASYSQLYPGITGDQLRLISASAASHFDVVGTIGLGVKSFRADMWKEQEIVGSYAQQITENIAVGGSAKFLYWSSESPAGSTKWTVPEPGMSKSTIAFDAGVLFTLRDFLPSNDFQAGLMIADLNQPLISVKDTGLGKLDMRIEGSAAYISRVYDYSILLHLLSDRDGLRAVVGSEITAVKSTVGNAPFALIFRGAFGLRRRQDETTDLAGVKSTSWVTVSTEIDGGLGLQVGDLQLDYAFGSPAELTNAGGTHHWTLRYTF